MDEFRILTKFLTLLEAYSTEMENLVDQMFMNNHEYPGEPNIDLSEEQIECLQLPGDDLPFNEKSIGTIINEDFGPAEGILDNDDSSQQRLQYEFSTTFVGANPRNIIDYQVLIGYKLYNL